MALPNHNQGSDRCEGNTENDWVSGYLRRLSWSCHPSEDICGDYVNRSADSQDCRYYYVKTEDNRFVTW